MRRIKTFVLGVVTGALVIYGATNYHLVRAREGLHLVPKTSSRMAETYVDIRNFDVSDWAEHPQLALALIQADRQDLVENAAADALHHGLQRLLDSDGSR